MRRRDLLGAVSGAGAVALAGCGILTTGPEPTVVEHVRGDVVVTGTERVFELDGGGGRVRATVENSGYDATVDLRLYWVPEVGADPAGKPHEQLLAAGYEFTERERFDLKGGERRTHAFQSRYPGGVAGHYVRKRNLTYGAIVENEGKSGAVTADLLDTSDPESARTLRSKRVEMAPDERRPVLFRTDERFDVFRVEVV